MPKDNAKTADLDKMSREELIELRNQVDRMIQTVDKRRRDDAMAKARAAAEEHGFKLEDLVGGGKSAGAKAGSASAPKYRHPENAEKTWTGRGRQPGWVKEHLQAGNDLEDLRI